MPTPTYNTSHPVMVTGATGYVAGWIVRRLLQEGFAVHATVRNPDDSDRIAHLTGMAEELPGSIRFFRADLLEAGAFDAAMTGCAVVIHTASPFTLSVRDPQRDLVDPAVMGTRNVLQAANRCDGVRRVVVTSSLAAIYGDSADRADAPGGILTEEVWNSSSSLAHNPYSLSKTLAEKAAWEIAGAQDRWRLVTINPGFVLGPGLARRQTSESFTLMRQMGRGDVKSGMPHIEMGMVDVRDVAEAHLRAAFLPDARGRNIVIGETHSLFELAGMLRPEFGDSWPLPRRELPKWLVWLVGPMINSALTRRFVSRNVGHAWRADNAKSIRELGMEYHPIATAVTGMFGSMIENGEIARR